ncbi:MAG: hypothetical protein JNM39_14825 [Bdellovibrionaceae bacterium]|nr:hypothetical protein [Pseudobdellovibrionaceae bacterium]
MKKYVDVSSKSILYQKRFGRIRPLVLAVIILLAGLLLDKWWWQIGGILVLVIFVEAFYRYRT